MRSRNPPTLCRPSQPPADGTGVGCNWNEVSGIHDEFLVRPKWIPAVPGPALGWCTHFIQPNRTLPVLVSGPTCFLQYVDSSCHLSLAVVEDLISGPWVCGSVCITSSGLRLCLPVGNPRKTSLTSSGFGVGPGCCVSAAWSASSRLPSRKPLNPKSTVF